MLDVFVGPVAIFLIENTTIYVYNIFTTELSIHRWTIVRFDTILFFWFIYSLQCAPICMGSLSDKIHKICLYLHLKLQEEPNILTLTIPEYLVTIWFSLCLIGV